jgi:hypothetical protein
MLVPYEAEEGEVGGQVGDPVDPLTGRSRRTRCASRFCVRAAATTMRSTVWCPRLRLSSTVN